jgi:hypothetical protein
MICLLFFNALTMGNEIPSMHMSEDSCSESAIDFIHYIKK